MTEGVVVGKQQDGGASQSKINTGRTMVALGFGYFVDQGEGQAMSVLFPTLQAMWGLSYTQLGVIGTIRNLLQAVTAPFWGFAADKYPRKNVIVFGTGLWGIWTFLCGFAGSYEQLLVLRAISGIGLGCLLPATFSLVADAFPPQRRGRALGTLEGIGTFGIVIGVLALGMMATPTLWRFGFFTLGLFSILSGLLVWFLVAVLLVFGVGCYYLDYAKRTGNG
jgi:MFS family permease